MPMNCLTICLFEIKCLCSDGYQLPPVHLECCENTNSIHVLRFISTNTTKLLSVNTTTVAVHENFEPNVAQKPMHERNITPVCQLSHKNWLDFFLFPVVIIKC
ncbi:2-N-acetylglucosaminyltransferase [Striga asiatica]|uniref:2-N-acetylglucosaminyltransferase n=1 Tax=Striga asiatica TaxID=4170 RepID=A0A5A7PQ26_STRAF|nr:2-N-acetylglucosaminyltransferase [Striga asiatica]